MAIDDTWQTVHVHVMNTRPSTPTFAMLECLGHSRGVACLEAEIVKYRDKVSGKLVEARVPTTLLALLRLRASCSGKPLSDQKLARMAVDVPLG